MQRRNAASKQTPDTAVAKPSCSALWPCALLRIRHVLRGVDSQRRYACAKYCSRHKGTLLSCTAGATRTCSWALPVRLNLQRGHQANDLRSQPAPCALLRRLRAPIVPVHTTRCHVAPSARLAAELTGSKGRSQLSGFQGGSPISTY